MGWSIHPEDVRADLREQKVVFLSQGFFLALAELYCQETPFEHPAFQSFQVIFFLPVGSLSKPVITTLIGLPSELAVSLVPLLSPQR